VVTIDTCKRCSVLRVNALCKLHERAITNQDPGAYKQLKAMVGLAARRGYAGGRPLLGNSLPDEAVRSLSWNVASVLTDDDLHQAGIEVTRR
jgi:hypothetical protein